MKLEVKAVKHLDINSKEQLYLVIGEAENKVIINIGEKTYEKVKKITNETTGKPATGNKMDSNK